jgi:hypothetical protein
MNDLGPATQAAFDIALTIVQDTPTAPPLVEVRYVDRNADIEDARYLIILFRAVGFLVDKGANTTRTIPLGVEPGAEQEQVLREKAKVLALRQGLGVVYVPTPIPD